jgi:hypothetical protein
VSDGTDASGVRLSELVAALSYATDLGWVNRLRTACARRVIALWLGGLVGIDDREREARFYSALPANACCHAGAAEQARWFGDDIAFTREAFDVLEMSTPQMIAALLRRTTSPAPFPWTPCA